MDEPSRYCAKWKLIKERQMPYNFACIWILKNKTKQICLQTWRTDCWLPERGMGRIGEGDEEVQTCNYKIS